MKSLDALTFPLSGASLIEASAGTGKTYTIVNVFLRLLLGHGCRPHDLQEILLVTFTNAATAELRQRIRVRLQEALRALLNGQTDDPFLASLLETLPDREDARLRLVLAIREMDSASVFTIHGFSQRMLAEFAFESGLAYDQELILDESHLRQLAVEDYWRREIVQLPPDLLKLLQTRWPDPANMQQAIATFLNRDVLLANAPDIEMAKQAFASYVERAQALKRWWLDNDIETQLLNANLKRNVKTGKPTYASAVTAWCHQASSLPPFAKEGWALFGTASVKKAMSKQSQHLELALFERFDALHDVMETLKQTVVSAFHADAIDHIRQNLSQHKQRLQLLGPDDLLAHLRNAVCNANSKALTDAIAKRFPAALIDEFQDTDAAQFDIFQRIYAPACEHGDATWVMIGDPKQAIYAFRGADIFTYIKAKRWVEQSRHFTLATNWRSCKHLVEAVNVFFSRSDEGFLYQQDIPFIAVNAAREDVKVSVGERELPALAIDWLKDPEDQPISWSVAQSWMAKRCARDIAVCLSQGGQIGNRPIRPADCCVLVRDRNEADAVKQALAEQSIRSVFLVRQSVFATDVCQDLYLLLTSLAHPNDDKAIRAALATALFCHDAQTLDQIYNDEMAWQSLVERWYVWHRMWRQQGLMAACYALASFYSLFEKQMQGFADGMRRITDLRHLFELLQQQSHVFQTESQLLQWLAECMADPDHNSESQQMRLESDQNLVQIVTMHASKGLEYPLVFIPFAARHRQTSQAIYHDDNGKLQVDFNQPQNLLDKADYERLAEDIRLLYVAMTRAVYHCRVGLWNAAHATRKKQSVFAQSALGRLLLGPLEAACNQSLENALSSLSSTSSMRWDVLELGLEQVISPIQNPVNTEASELCLSALTHAAPKDWFVTSFSALSRHGQHDVEATPGRDEHSERDANTQETQALNAFSFDKGANAGSFLHGVLENIVFSRPDNLAQVVAKQADWYGIDSRWLDMVSQWILDVLACPICWKHGELAKPLQEVPARQMVVEMEFHLPLEALTQGSFNTLLQQYASHWYRPYSFGKLHGMLKGFIDLTLEVDGRFYVADYKSNYLGPDEQHYLEPSLHDAMVSHDYYLQATLYLVALHRYLKARLPDYQYDRHIGGAVYLFLRGMRPDKADAGVLHYQPDKQLILGLDALFGGVSPTPPDKPVQGQLPL